MVFVTKVKIDGSNVTVCARVSQTASDIVQVSKPRGSLIVTLIDWNAVIYDIGELQPLHFSL